jgi:hypothetical protein
MKKLMLIFGLFSSVTALATDTVTLLSRQKYDDYENACYSFAYGTHDSSSPQITIVNNNNRRAPAPAPTPAPDVTIVNNDNDDADAQQQDEDDDWNSPRSPAEL